MADGFIQVAPDGSGKKVDTTELAVGANTVERQRFHIAGTAAAALVEPLNSTPAGTEYALPVRTVGTPSVTVGNTVTVSGSVSASVSGTVGISGTVPVSGTFWQATQPVSISGSVPVTGTFFQATQPISIASMPSTPVTGTFWQATQPVSIASMPSTPVTGTFWQATQPVSGTVTSNQGTANTAANAWFIRQTDGTNNGTIKAASTAAAATDTALVVALHPTSPVTQAAITKGTQGATGVTTQDIKDAGRSARTFNLDSFAVAATAETLMTMSYSTDNGTATTGTSYTVTTGKRLRIQAITATLHTITGNTTAVNVIVRIRALATAPALVASPLQLMFAIPGIASVNGASTAVDVAIPDGWEFAAGAGVAVTITCAGFVATTAAPKVNLTITGYEY